MAFSSYTATLVHFGTRSGAGCPSIKLPRELYVLLYFRYADRRTTNAEIWTLVTVRPLTCPTLVETSRAQTSGSPSCGSEDLPSATSLDVANSRSPPRVGDAAKGKTANPSTAVRLRCLLNTAHAYEPPIGIRTHPFKCFAAADGWLSHAAVAPSRVASRAATLLLAILAIF